MPSPTRPTRGRPPTAREKFKEHEVPLSHGERPRLVRGSVVRVAWRIADDIPNLRSKKRLEAIAEAFDAAAEREQPGFTLTQWAVGKDQIQLIATADSSGALSAGMRALGMSISRVLNAQSVRAAGGVLNSKTGGKLSKQPGWLGRVFADRYFIEVLKRPADKAAAIAFVKSLGRGAP